MIGGRFLLRLWSPDGVDRYTDSTTHNHGSTANTANWTYTDKRANRPPNECIYDCIKIERECGTGVSKKEAEEMCRGKKAVKNKAAQKKKGAKWDSRLAVNDINFYVGYVSQPDKAWIMVSFFGSVLRIDNNGHVWENRIPPHEMFE